MFIALCGSLIPDHLKSPHQHKVRWVCLHVARNKNNMCIHGHMHVPHLIHPLRSYTGYQI